jgi:hypothetical protein
MDSEQCKQDTVEPEGRQMKQCWIKYERKKQKKTCFLDFKEKI